MVGPKGIAIPAHRRTTRMPGLSRILTAIAALLLITMFFLPLWSIQLQAPQYPEGLGMYIRLNTIVGTGEFDLAKINSLNHYIGMKAIDAEAIPELRFMPWIVAALVAAGLAVAAIGRRRLLVAWLAAFALLGVAGLADFYRWSYDYGHNLDAETAIITVPGMTYQPPLIGTKQLLNFRASSWPASGALLAGLAFGLGALAAVIASRRSASAAIGAAAIAGRRAARAAIAAAAIVVAACGPAGPAHMAYDGTESCEYCRMAITDPRYGTQLMTKTGKTLRFDSIECLVSYSAQMRDGGTVASVWVSDVARPGTFVASDLARFVRQHGSEGSPMGLGIAAHGPGADDASLRRDFGEVMTWTDVVTLVQAERSPPAGTVTPQDTVTSPGITVTSQGITVSPQGIAVSPQGITLSPQGAAGSIAEAIRIAQPGSRIVIRAGTYREPMIIVDKPLEIVGEGWPVLDGEGARQIMAIGADDVTVRGLVFRNVGTSFVEDRAAIKVTSASRCVIDGNRFENAFFGIYLADVTECRITGNVLHASIGTEATSGNGIHLWKSSDVTVEDNHVSGHRDGIYLEFARNAVVRRNTSEHNLRYGLHFMYADDCEYIANTFRHNLAGVAVMYAKRVAMTDNLFEDNWGAASYGLLLKEISDARIERNRFHRNTVGLFADGAARIIAADNEFTANGWAVKLMASTYDGRFERNDFVRNTFDLSSNSSAGSSQFIGNHFDAYRGYDLDRDGYGDVPHRPVRLFSVLVERNAPALILLRSVFVDLLDAAERVLPVLTPAELADARPAMRALHAGGRP